MSFQLVSRPDVQDLLDRVSGQRDGKGDPRMAKIMRKIIADLFETIDQFDVSPEEFWSAVHFMQGAAPEYGLIAPGLGFDHFLDLRIDAADADAGMAGGTPRTIEGPLYVPGAPISDNFARLDDGTDKGETLIMLGVVSDTAGYPVAGAVVDVWHANTLGNYSYFDPSQTDYNNRRRIRTSADGTYKFQSVMPSGYAVPPGGATERLLGSIGRHGRRPAHIHFFVSAPGKRHLTTQINIADDPLVHDDFAVATREGLIPNIVRHDDPDAIRAEGLNTPFAKISFDFILVDAVAGSETELHARPRASAIA
jgi:catechol 1,2-dioxygenase